MENTQKRGRGRPRLPFDVLRRRGSKNATKKRQAEERAAQAEQFRITDIRTPPKQLQGTGAEFWRSNAPDLWQSGKLTGDTIGMFILLCDTVGDYYDQDDSGADSRARLLGAITELAGKFGLTPDVR